MDTSFTLMGMLTRIRNHRAPKGALRHEPTRLPICPFRARVRKHRAPEGALRLAFERDGVRRDVDKVRQQRAPKCALRQRPRTLGRCLAPWSESTERPKFSHAIALVQTSMNGENRDISTMQLQVLKEWKPNCMRHFLTTLQGERHKVH